MDKIMKSAVTLAFLLLVSTPALAAGIPDLDNSIVTWAYQGGETLSLMNLPDGSGHGFTQALLPGTPDGSAPAFVDATITLTMLDGGFTPVAHFPFEDLWLESADGGMRACLGGTCADANTDMNGETTWRYPLQAGGWSEGPILVLINGDALDEGSLPLKVNSPDIDGSSVVDLADVGRFASDYFTSYDYRSDFNYDGVLNLADVGYLAMGLRSACP